MTVLLIGSGAREHAIARAIHASPQKADLVCFGSNWNPGIRELSTAYTVGKVTDAGAVTAFAREHAADLAIVGPEAPLAAGVADALWAGGIPVVGPKERLARIETSKRFTRDLLTRHRIPACPRYRYFTGLDGVADTLHEFGDRYVVKYDGLLGGKGVKVAGDHLHSHDEALAYCRELVEQGRTFLIEEKLEGEEFSLMSFCDGEHLAHMPPVQDHKRAYVGDRGPNTGGMGSYSDADHSLPFLRPEDIRQARQINEAAAHALKAEFGEGYRGILYGGFMVTRDGVKLIEYNARFGDPEGMNVLALLESDFLAVCRALVAGELTPDLVRFAHRATVCKYAVPEGYPEAPVKNQPIDVSAVKDPSQLYFASVDAREGVLYEAGSRTVAYVGIADTLQEAEALAEAEIARVKGPLFHREDIGTVDLIQKRVAHMKTLRN
jgi:phosphoribosylamine--glycine ligase